MLTTSQKAFLDKASEQAEDAGHIFPTMAACEAALESNYGQSGLAVSDNNLFGMKQHTHPVYGTHVLPTREFIRGQWIKVDAAWVHYPDQMSCFMDRMATLHRLAALLNKDKTLEFPHYAKALETHDQYEYIDEVSATWSTDPFRAKKVSDIHERYMPSAPLSLHGIGSL